MFRIAAIAFKHFLRASLHLEKAQAAFRYGPTILPKQIIFVITCPGTFLTTSIGAPSFIPKNETRVVPQITTKGIFILLQGGGIWTKEFRLKPLHLVRAIEGGAIFEKKHMAATETGSPGSN